MGSEIELIKDDGIGVITVNRPEFRNALNATAWIALENAFLEAKADRDIRVIVVTGAGDKAFVAGADLNALRERSVVDTFSGKNQEILTKIESIGKPTIAAINGFALGGGLELALACDLRICSRNAKLGQTEINVGILPGGGGTQRLARLVGLGKAKEMIFTGKIISAEQAEKMGLVNSVVDPDKLMESVLELARQLVAKSPWVLQIAKYVMNTGIDVDLNTALALERFGQTVAFSSSDHMEGIMAFLEKRVPNFVGY